MGVPAAALVVAALTVLHGAAAITIQVPPADLAQGKGCTGFQFTVSLDKYNFTSFMGDYTVPAGCNATNIKCAISRRRHSACPHSQLLVVADLSSLAHYLLS